VLLIHASPGGELGAALEIATSLRAEVLGALPQPVDLVRLVELLGRHARPGDRASSPLVTRLSRHELKSTLRDAPDIPQLVLHYQPKITVASGMITGVEALARWQHREHGLLGPQEFIPLAVQSELIDQFSFRICQLAVAQTAAWQRLGVQLRTSINIPMNTFTSPDFNGFLSDLTHQHQLRPGQLALEVAESQVMQNTADCIEVLNLLHDQHIGLSIDDFGLGSSTLSHLRAIPFNELKIDRSLAHGAARNSNQRSLLKTSIGLAREFGMRVVAVGIENREDWDIVEELGCDMVQGYYCSPPLPADELYTFFHRWQGPHRGR